MIRGFVTKSGSKYYVDLQNRKIWGGALGNNVRTFKRGSRIIAGERCHLEFEEGGEITTNVVDEYL